MTRKNCPSLENPVKDLEDLFMALWQTADDVDAEQGRCSLAGRSRGEQHHELKDASGTAVSCSCSSRIFFTSITVYRLSSGIMHAYDYNMLSHARRVPLLTAAAMSISFR